MRFYQWVIFVILVVFISPVLAEHKQNITKESAIGGGLGGAAGGAIGAEIGGRNGAIIGSAAGAALGTIILTDDERGDDQYHDVGPRIRNSTGWGHPFYRHCPPGQAKKGRC